MNAAPPLFLLALSLGWLEAARRWLGISRHVFDDRAVRWVRMELLVLYWLAIVKDTALGPYDGQVLLLKARKGRPRITDPALGWTPYLSRLEIVAVEGDHWTMLRHLQGLERLDRALADLERASPDPGVA